MAESDQKLVTAAFRAIAKVKREYKRVQPDAAPDECWAEVEAFEQILLDWIYAHE